MFSSTVGNLDDERVTSPLRNGFRTSKEWRSYPTRLNRWLSMICVAAFISGIGVPLIVAI